MAAGYRLAGAVLDHICSRHLYGDDRMLIAWPANDRAIVIAIGPHDQSTDDVYDVLLDHLGLEAVETEREKPPCCDHEGRPPADPNVASDIVDAIECHCRARRRGR